MVLNLTIPFKLYVADALEAIEVLKTYLNEDKKGGSYIPIYFLFFFTTAVYVFLLYTIYNTYITYNTNTSEVYYIAVLLFSITVRLIIIITVKLIIVIIIMIMMLIANEPTERRREGGEAAAL